MQSKHFLIMTLVVTAGAWTSTASAQDANPPANATDVAPATSATDAAQAASAVQPTGPSGVLRFGSLYSFGGGKDLQHGFGMDARYQLFPVQGEDGYIGVYSQGQYELGGAWRFSGGITGGWGIAGLDVGVAHRTATAMYAGSTGLQIAPSVTLGPVTIGGRLTIPLVNYVSQNVANPAQVQGFEAALTVSMSFGFTVHGPRRGHGAGCCCPGHSMHHH